MSLPYDRVLRGNFVLPDRVLEGGYVAVRGESIAAIGAGEPPPAGAVEDHRGRLVFPGLVDGHMHTASSVGWPGIEGATRSAAAGGVTTCCDMPYDVPLPVADAAILAEKVEAVGRLAQVDVALYGTIRKDGGVEEVSALAAGGVTAFKLSTYEYDAVRFPRIEPGLMREALAEIARTNLMVAVHNEDQELVEGLTARARAAGRTDPIMHCRTRPPLAENLANGAIFEIGLETGAHVHIAHSSLARGFELARSFRAAGGRASGEACVHYLCMTEEDVVRLEGMGKCNPPFRPAEEVDRMWEAIARGLVGYVSTDHAPWPPERKAYRGDIFAVGAGLTGMQSFAPLMFTLIEERGLSPTLMARLCSDEPARHHGLDPRKGRLAVGADADLCVIERGEFVFDQSAILDQAIFRHSAYHGRRMRGRVAATYLRGAKIWDGERVLAEPGTGRFLPRQHGRPVALP